MQNMKITLHLGSPAVLDRLTTIDSILLSCYYKHLDNLGEHLPFDKEHKTVKFIHREKGVFSGSIWYVEKDQFVTFDFQTIYKKPEYERIHQSTGSKVKTDSRFKGAMIDDELFLAKKIHFYVRGDMKVIEAILQSTLSNVGKYARLNYGEVTSYDIEEIDTDKGYMLNPTTPSKPLPINDFKVESKKIAFSRRSAPYWLDEDIEACYMPTTSLYESVDNSIKKDFNVAKDTSYISNVQFIYNGAFNPLIPKGDIKFLKSDYSEFVIPKKVHFEYITNNTSLKCAFSGDISKEGMKQNSRNFINRIKKSFGDYDYMKNNEFVSKESLWCIDNVKALSYLYLSNTEWYYLQGKESVEGSKINDILLNLSMLKSPFSINLKKTQNTQHVSFKGMVSISNAYFYVQIGNKRLSIDSELFTEAIEDIANIIEEYPEITKTHLCRNFRDVNNVSLKSKNRQINEIVIMNFQKKYDSNIRNLLNWVAY